MSHGKNVTAASTNFCHLGAELPQNKLPSINLGHQSDTDQHYHSFRGFLCLNNKYRSNIHSLFSCVLVSRSKYLAL